MKELVGYKWNSLTENKLTKIVVSFQGSPTNWRARKKIEFKYVLCEKTLTFCFPRTTSCLFQVIWRMTSLGPREL